MNAQLYDENPLEVWTVEMDALYKRKIWILQEMTQKPEV